MVQLKLMTRVYNCIVVWQTSTWIWMGGKISLNFRKSESLYSSRFQSLFLLKASWSRSNPSIKSDKCSLNWSVNAKLNNRNSFLVKLTLCTFLPYKSIKAKMAYVDGWSVNIWHVCNFWKRTVMLTAEPSTYDMFLFRFLKIKIKTYHMLMAQPSTYDNFQTYRMLTAEPSTYD